MRGRLDGVIETVSAQDLADQPGRGLDGARAFHRLRHGERPLPIPADARHITELEAVALATARASLAVPSPPGSQGALADALGGLIRRLGLPDDPGSIVAQPAGPQAPYDAAALTTCLRAIRSGSSLQGSYRPRHRAEHPVRIQPVRVLLVAGEAFLWAWDAEDRIAKRYHLSRLTIARVGRRLADAPADRVSDVAILMRHAFRGVAREAMRTVRVRINPRRLVSFGSLVFATDQRVADNPDGSRTVTWRTRGLQSLAEWIVGTSGGVVAESPSDLRQAVQAVARTALAAHDS
jgi:predicted DNA-binding transcriptional regulator YafY